MTDNSNVSDIPALKKVWNYKVSLLKELFNQLEEGQQNKFNRFFGGVATIDPDKIDHATFLCEKTIKENKEKQTLLNS